MKLEALHPAPQPDPDPLPEDPSPLPPGLFESIYASLIRSLAGQLRGAAGPSGLSTDILRILCRSKGPEADSLCWALAEVARRLASSPLPRGCISCLLSSRLVALDKGRNELRPVGIGESIRRLLGKAIMSATRDGLQQACGAVQACSGMSGACEAAARSLQEMWDETGTEVILLVDARNAFNLMARARALRTARDRCPDLAVAFHNFYGSDSSLFLGDGMSILSREGTTQGCPLGMAMFAISSLPLISRVAGPGVRQVWYADDSAAAGSVVGVRAWFGRLRAEGGEFGYEIKLSKTVAIVKPGAEARFMKAFEGLTDPEHGGLRAVCSGIPPLDEMEGVEFDRLLGQRYLGAGLGSITFREACVRKKVSGWAEDVKRLAALGRTHPQPAYCLLVRCLLPKWRYTMRTTDVNPSLFDPLEDVLVSHFFPQVFGWKPATPDLRQRCGLPTRHGGLGIPIPSELATEERAASTKLTEPLTAAILEQDDGYVEDLRGSRARRAQRQRERDKALQAEGDGLASRLSGRAARGFEEARSRGGSAWLSFIPLESLGLDLDAETFRDAISLRMGQELPHPLPSTCPSCGEKMSISHALKCKKGGWVNRRHREVLKAWMRYLEKGGYLCH